MKKTLYIFLISIILLFSIILFVDIKYKSTFFPFILHNKSLKRPIQIVYITDDNYITQTSTSINSLYKNKKEETEVEVYIIGVKLKKNDIDLLNGLNKKKLKIKIIKYDKYFDELPSENPANPGVTRADYTKFAISSILTNLNKVIYLDGDTIILKDLSDLYNINLKNNYIGAADDWQSKWDDNRDARYFNNGVMLMNLKKMRKDNIDKKLLNYKLHEKEQRFVTQDTFNNVMYNKVMYIPLQYNTFALFYDSEYILYLLRRNLGKNFNKNIYPYKTPDGYRDSVVIIHYCGWGYIKPWWEDTNTRTSKIWYKYANEE